MLNSVAPLVGSVSTRLPGTIAVVSASAQERESVEAVVSRLATAVRARAAAIVALFVYGDIAARDVTTSIIRRYLGAIDWPVLWVDGGSCNGSAVAGMQAFIVRGVELERVLINGRVVATMFSDGDARHCFVAGIGPDDPSAPRGAQALSTFENLKTVLGRAGFDFADIVRTWFYNEHLLDWYDTFNRVRTGYYSAKPFRSGSLPASTGIEASNPFGAALAVAAWAFQPVDDGAAAFEVVSPLQCAATQYGSSFSRAMEIDSAGVRRLLISGTASIAPGGASLWPGDITRQVATTMDVVDAILASQGMTFADVMRATTYFKAPQDVAAFEAWGARNGVQLPLVAAHCDICRDDLLFEIELDACSDQA